MKKLLLSLIALLGIGVYAMADEVTVETAQVRVGNSGVMQLVLTTDKTDYYRDFQFTLELPAGITVKEIVDEEDATVITHGTTGDACSSKHILASNIVQSDPQVVNYVVNTTTGNKIKSGILANVTLESSTSLSVGNTLQGKVTGIEITDDQNGKHNFDDVTFKIEIVENRIVFNETDAYLPTYDNGETANIRMNRTFKANEWNTLCLPFQLSQANAKKIFGENVTFMQFNGVEAEFNDELEPTSITIHFTTKTLNALSPLTAGTPVLVKPENDINTFDLDNITLPAAETKDVEKGITIGGEVSEAYFGRFIGLFTKQLIPENGLFISNNKFYYSTGNTTTKAFRGYFMIDAVLGQPITSEVRVDFTIDGVTTKIDGINVTNSNNDAVYTLDGRRVSRTPQTKGVFIQNGKKVVK